METHTAAKTCVAFYLSFIVKPLMYSTLECTGLIEHALHASSSSSKKSTAALTKHLNAHKMCKTTNDNVKKSKKTFPPYYLYSSLKKKTPPQYSQEGKQVTTKHDAKVNKFKMLIDEPGKTIRRDPIASCRCFCGFIIL